jgi:hypothetical protein
MKRIGTLVTIALLLAGRVATAQHEHGGATHEQLGTVTFDTSCAPAVKTDFNRGVALLHSFEYGPATESFNKVLERDPSCAIAYWGIALAQWTNPFGGIKSGPLLERGRATIEKGLSTGQPTARERAYIAAVAELYKDADKVPHRDRTVAYARAMEALQREYPKDVEARIFYALALNQTALPTDKTYAVHHPRVRSSATCRQGSRRGAALREDRALGPACAAHALAHVHPRRLLEGFRRDQHRIGADGAEAERLRRSAARDGLPGVRLLADGTG